MTTKTRTTDVHALVSLLVLGEYNVEVGREVVDALAGMGRRAVPALIEVLRHPDGRHGRVTRMAAAWLLGRTGGKRALDALCRIQDDPDPDVADLARRRLAALGQPACGEAAAA